jgi:hypothetical protein
MIGGGFVGFDVAGQEVGVTSFLGARLAREAFGEGRLALHEVVEAGLDSAKIVEVVHALGAGAEFARGLRASEEQDAENGDFVAVEVEGFLEAVLVLGDAAV